MTHAPTLRQLLDIRQRNARYLRSIRGYLGSAIGHKHTGGQPVLDAEGQRVPAVLVFVEKKADVPKKQRIHETLQTTNGLSCLTDVVQGIPAGEAPIARPLDGESEKVQRELRHGPIEITGGIPLTSDVSTGTAACVVRSTAKKDRGQRGLLTNWHVAGLTGNRLLQPQPLLRPIGVTTRIVFTAPKTKDNYDDLESFTNAEHRLDAGFIAIHDGNRTKLKPGVHALGPLGEPHKIDLDSTTLDLVGQNVLGVGQMLGLQRGKIVAYGYEWKPDPDDDLIYATDYLIVGTGDGQPFAAAGDSGKLVITDDGKHTPVALLWGGQRQGFWDTHAQESWAYASAIRTVLDTLEVEIEYPTLRRDAK